MSPRFYLSLPLALLLGLAIHLDWHLARHEHDGRSLGWDAHWLVAIPIFALAAWYIARRWPPPDTPWRPATLADEVEPARLTAFALFTVTGLVAMGLTLWALARRSRSQSS